MPLLGLKEFRCCSTSSLTLTEPNKNDHRLTFPEVRQASGGSDGVDDTKRRASASIDVFPSYSNTHLLRGTICPKRTPF